MFIQNVHAETDTAVLLQFIKENTLGILTTGIPSSQQEFLQSSHVPFVLDLPEDAGPSAHQGRLRAHIAKQNPQVKAMVEVMKNRPASNNSDGVFELYEEVLVLFNSRHDHYVTPKYYMKTKPDTGKVVPTWNYSAVQIYGKLFLYYDSKMPATKAFLDKQLHDLSKHTERSIMGYTGDGDAPPPWKVADAPERFIELMQRNIVGIEIRIHKLQGKFKMSQEMRSGDRDGVVRGFARMGGETGDAISDLVRERGELHHKKKQAMKAL